MIAARADVVGSLLRPRELLEARESLERGEIGPPEFKRVEGRRGRCGDPHAGGRRPRRGHRRRGASPVISESAHRSGGGLQRLGSRRVLWGDWHGEQVGDKRIDRPPIAVLGRLRRRRSPCVEEFAYPRGRTQRIVKVTLPSPSLFANFYDPERSPGAYPTLESFLADVAEILREEVDELVRLGCEYVQLDAPHYPLLLDPAYRDFYASSGRPAERWLVTTKLETRIREAARYVPLERLALSAQCGFATSILGNALSAADQEAKLRTIVATAERVWG